MLFMKLDILELISNLPKVKCMYSFIASGPITEEIIEKNDPQ